MKQNSACRGRTQLSYVETATDKTHLIILEAQDDRWNLNTGISLALILQCSLDHQDVTVLSFLGLQYF